MSTADAAQFNKKGSSANAKSFTEKLDSESLAFFNSVSSKPFADQAMAFLNAYWYEVSSEAEFIYTVSYDKMRYADMHFKGIQLVYKYEEGNDGDFDQSLYFFEQLNKFCEDSKNAALVSKYPRSVPQMMTALKRKQELREKVDVNFDGRVSFLEYLLDQYQDVANPADFCTRSMNHEEHPEITKARMALKEVNERVAAYEAEKHRLEEQAKLPGVKGLAGVNLLAQLHASPLAEQLNAALIKAEAAVRIAQKKYGGQGSAGSGGSSDGALWWLARELEEKKKRYGPQKK